MKKLLLSVILGFMATTQLYAQSVEDTDQQFDTAFEKRDIEAMFAVVSPDCVFYGTDASEKWDYTAFKKMIENGFKNGMPSMQVISRELLPINKGKAMMIIKKINWSIFKTELREVAIYEKQKGSWKMKTLTLNLTIPNQKTKALNELLVLK